MILEKLIFKNINSYGQNPTEIPLNNNLINIIIGKNGKGKSTILDAISFVLTGKPYRDINKAQLVNSINKKGLLVELYFTSGNNSYIIKRGIKPNIFEIYKNDKLLDQSAKVVDYQKILDDIIKIDLKILKQSIIMSSKYYKPFLEMTKAEKRFYIEEILNIKMFSIMSDKVKSLNRSAKQENGFLEKDIERIESNILLMKQMKEKSDQQNEVKHDELLKDIEKSEKNITQYKTQLENHRKEVVDLTYKYSKHKDKYDIHEKLNSTIWAKEQDIQRIKKEIQFMKTSKHCTTCHQDITEEYRTIAIENYNVQINEIESGINDLTIKKNKVKIVVDKLDKIKDRMDSLKHFIMTNEMNITDEERKVSRYKKEINVLQDNKTTHIDKTDSLKKEKKKIEKNINQLEKNLKYYKVLLKLLADDGIKRYIIQKYLNVFNSYVNKYLELLNTNYRIKFNDEFEESIIANGYETLQYGNFSGGERQRLDLAILFAFVELARNRNSVNCNVIFLDEIADSALDEEGVLGMFKILEHLKRDGYTPYIISHRTGVNQYCDKTFEAVKKTFSNIKEVE
jgi:DNA repair exonuclease SbcCD ATPase subunit